MAKARGRSPSTKPRKVVAGRARPDVGKRPRASALRHAEQMARGPYIQQKLRAGPDMKKALAQRVAEVYVNDFDAVLLDAGSTAECVAEAMFANRRYLSVLTNNMGAYAAYTRAIAIAGEKLKSGVNPRGRQARGLLSENELLLPGGRYDPTYEALFGLQAIEAIGHFSPNITIIGVSGLRWGAGEGEGVFCHGSEEVAMKKLLWRLATDTRLVVTDWTKIGRRDAHSFGHLCELGLNARRAVVVTSRPPRDAAAAIRREFDDQLGRMEKGNVEVDIVSMGNTAG